MRADSNSWQQQLEAWDDIVIKLLYEARQVSAPTGFRPIALSLWPVLAKLRVRCLLPEHNKPVSADEGCKMFFFSGRRGYSAIEILLTTRLLIDKCLEWQEHASVLGGRRLQTVFCLLHAPLLASRRAASIPDCLAAVTLRLVHDISWRLQWDVLLAQSVRRTLGVWQGLAGSFQTIVIC